MSAVSLYYYLQVLKRVYVASPPASSTPLHTPILTTLVIALIAAAVLILGCAPRLLLDPILAAIQASGL